MSHDQIIPELFKGPTKAFNSHIEIEGNKRILVSGRFGIGKTTFLSHFFREKRAQYNVIHLFPINYSLFENEDIFSYIKYDILVSLFANSDYPLKPDYYKFLKTWDAFILQNLGQVVATTMLLIPKMGKQLHQFVNEIRQMASDFKKFGETKTDSEMSEINAFLTEFHEAEGGIYESNIITLIIQEWLRDIRQKGKENVLVIDDLDRIDPAHIFRLLNVFSAHFDSGPSDGSANKFGFNRVVLVCDIENVQNIFWQQFGIGTDFNGYIDKFYSKEIFRFDNRENILSILSSLCSSINLRLDNRGNLIDHPESNYIKDFLLIVLKALVVSNRINLRSLFKYYTEDVIIAEDEVVLNGRTVTWKENLLLSSIYVLSLMIGNLGLLRNKIMQLSNLKLVSADNPSLFIGELIYLRSFHDYPRPIITVMNGITFDFELDSKRNFTGELMIIPPQRRERMTTSGVLQSLKIDDVEIDPNASKGEEIEIEDLYKDVFGRIRS